MGRLASESDDSGEDNDDETQDQRLLEELQELEEQQMQFNRVRKELLDKCADLEEQVAKAEVDLHRVRTGDCLDVVAAAEVAEKDHNAAEQLVAPLKSMIRGQATKQYDITQRHIADIMEDARRLQHQLLEARSDAAMTHRTCEHLHQRVEHLENDIDRFIQDRDTAIASGLQLRQTFDDMQDAIRACSVRKEESLAPTNPLLKASLVHRQVSFPGDDELDACIQRVQSTSDPFKLLADSIRSEPSEALDEIRRSSLRRATSQDGSRMSLRRSRPSLRRITSQRGSLHPAWFENELQDVVRRLKSSSDLEPKVSPPMHNEKFFVPATPSEDNPVRPTKSKAEDFLERLQMDYDEVRQRREQDAAGPPQSSSAPPPLSTSSASAVADVPQAVAPIAADRENMVSSPSYLPKELAKEMMALEDQLSTMKCGLERLGRWAEAMRQENPTAATQENVATTVATSDNGLTTVEGARVDLPVASEGRSRGASTGLGASVDEDIRVGFRVSVLRTITHKLSTDESQHYELAVGTLGTVVGVDVNGVDVDWTGFGRKRLFHKDLNRITVVERTAVPSDSPSLPWEVSAPASVPKACRGGAVFFVEAANTRRDRVRSGRRLSGQSVLSCVSTSSRATTASDGGGGLVNQQQHPPMEEFYYQVGKEYEVTAPFSLWASPPLDGLEGCDVDDDCTGTFDVAARVVILELQNGPSGTPNGSDARIRFRSCCDTEPGRQGWTEASPSGKPLPLRRLQPVHCPRGHDVEPDVMSKNSYCGLCCRRTRRGMRVMTCLTCSWMLCDKCHPER